MTTRTLRNHAHHRHTNALRYFVLDGDGEPVLWCEGCTDMLVCLSRWAEVMGLAQHAGAHTVAHSTGPQWEVSTVFLGIAVNAHGGRPQVFETLVTANGCSAVAGRASTRSGAKAMHARTCEALQHWEPH